MVFAIHFKVNAQRRPAGAEIGFPLKFDIATGHRKGEFTPVIIIEGHRARLRVNRLHRHVEHPARFRVYW